MINFRKSYQTRLGELIGTPKKALIRVRYKGVLYWASEEDVRYIQLLVAKHIDSKYPDLVADSSTNLTQVVMEDLGIEVFNQKEEQIQFGVAGTILNDFEPGFMDIDTDLAIERLSYCED